MEIRALLGQGWSWQAGLRIRDGHLYARYEAGAGSCSGVQGGEEDRRVNSRRESWVGKEERMKRSARGGEGR